MGGQDKVHKAPSHLLASSDSDAPYVSMSASESPAQKHNVLVGILGFPLLLGLMYFQFGSVLYQGNMVKSADLIAEESTFFIIKHTFKDADEVSKFWALTDSTTEEELTKSTEAGFYNQYFFPTATDGPFFCIWEAEAGKTKEDMQKFIDAYFLDQGVDFDNDVMDIPMKLAGDPPTGVTRFFSDGTEKERRLKQIDLNKERRLKQINLLDVKDESSFFIIKHTFESSDEISKFWEIMFSYTDKSGAELIKKTVKEGFYNQFFFPTAKEGPFFCIWEAEAGKTKDDMQKFIDTYFSPKGFVDVVFDNDVMDIKMNYADGDPPYNVKRYFK